MISLLRALSANNVLINVKGLPGYKMSLFEQRHRVNPCHVGQKKNIFQQMHITITHIYIGKITVAEDMTLTTLVK